MRKVCLFVLGLICGLTAAMSICAATFTEDFVSDPAQHGWKSFGEPSLFHWNSTNQNLEVTWCSTNRNSYFYRPLGTVLAKDDDWGISLDLRLRDIAIGINPEKSDTFQIAVGLINVRGASKSNYVRGAMSGPLNFAEFCFYPDSGWGATMSSSMVDSNHHWAYAYMYQDLTPSDPFHIAIHYAASNQTLYTSVMRNGQALDTSSASLLNPDFSAFTDFRVDAFSISSYSDEGQDPGPYDGSVLAHGTIDNVTITTPEAVVIPLSIQPNGREVQFASRTNWFYRLEGTSDLKSWTEVASSAGNGGALSLSDTNALPAQFYRIAAERP
jgi:hypothetical protein